MKEISNKRSNKKLIKKLSKSQTNSPTDGTNFELVLKERMEQQDWTLLTLSRRRPLSYRSQSIDLLWKSMDWFLYDNGFCLERVKSMPSLQQIVLSLTQTISNTFFMLGYMINQIRHVNRKVARIRTSISVYECCPVFIFKVFKEIQVQGNLKTILEVL